VSHFESNQRTMLWVPRRTHVRAFVCAILAFGLSFATSANKVWAEQSYAIAMHGAPALPADFTHMPYANPDAPKGGRLVQGLLGTFDSLNPLIVRGLAVQQIRGFVVESLMARGNDEAFTLYGLLAKSVEIDDARSYVTFHLDPKARFSDGQPVTSDDVLFSWALLRDKGRPNHRQYYSKVAKAEAPDPLTVRFDFGGVQDRELPLILGLMPILARHAVDVATFEETSMTAPVGSGPYRVGAVKPGASVTLTRNPDYSRRPQWRSDPRRHQDRDATPLRIPGIQHTASGVFRPPRASGVDTAVRFRVDQPQLLFRALCPFGELLCRLRTIGVWPPP
jgi:peptide/nickel transport system substrate-binding protein